MMVLFLAPQLSADLVGLVAKRLISDFGTAGTAAHSNIIHLARLLGAALPLVLSRVAIPALGWIPIFLAACVAVILEWARHTQGETRSVARILDDVAAHMFTEKHYMRMFSKKQK